LIRQPTAIATLIYYGFIFALAFSHCHAAAAIYAIDI
jgi:hypothetical protein